MEHLCSSDVAKFSLAGRELIAKAVEVYDGDTFKAIFELFPGHIVKMDCRLEGIDAPEMRGGDRVTDAIRARNHLCRLLTNCVTTLPEDKHVLTPIIDRENTQLITLQCGSFDKYGRLLCRVRANDSDVTTEMMETGLCHAYNGGKKEDWSLSSRNHT